MREEVYALRQHTRPTAVASACFNQSGLGTSPPPSGRFQSKPNHLGSPWMVSKGHNGYEPVCKVDRTTESKRWMPRCNPTNIHANEKEKAWVVVQTKMERKGAVERLCWREAENAYCDSVQQERPALFKLLQNPDDRAMASAHLKSWGACLSHDREEPLASFCTQ